MIEIFQLLLYSKLSLHLKNIAKKENGSISESALQLIARSSEGSVRDGISLLDRVLISQSINNKEIQDFLRYWAISQNCHKKT